MSVESNDNTETRDLRAFRAVNPLLPPPLPAGAFVDALGATGSEMSPSLLFGHTRDLDPTATMRTSASPITLTPRTRRDMEIWVPEASQLPLLSLGGGAEDVPLASSVVVSEGLLTETPDLSVTGILGEGGSGQVLLAYQRSMGREVAVKVPRDSEPWFAPTLLAEGRLAGRIEHPNVIPIYALGRSAQGAPILVMKRMRGATWEALMREPGHAVWDRFNRLDEKPGVVSPAPTASDYLEHNLSILLAVVQGISAAHRGGVVHRDVKPANVLVAGPDDVCVIDWGLALDLRDPRGATNLVGTPAFMAPEMLGSRHADGAVGERTDVYELGATLHFILTGRHRNQGATTDAILEALRMPSTVDLAEAPVALANIVKRATHFDPRERYPSAASFGDAIRAWLEQRSAERIARSADERLDQLSTGLSDYRLASASAQKPARAQLDRLASACRASIEDALALVPDLAQAKSARLRYLELWVSHLLDRNDVESARAELETAPGFVPELEARLVRIENDAAARLSRLHSLEQDLDLRPAARARKRFFLMAIGYAVTIFGLAFGILPRVVSVEALEAYSPLVFSLVSNALFWGVIYYGRKRLMLNAASRHIMAWVAVVLGFFLVHRLSVLVFGGVPVQRAFATEILTTAVMTTYATFAMSRRFWPAPLLNLTGYCCALAWPEYAPQLFGISSIAMLIVAARVWGQVSPQEPS